MIFSPSTTKHPRKSAKVVQHTTQELAIPIIQQKSNKFALSEKKNDKGVLHPELKINIFCALSQNNQHLLEKLHMHLIVNCLRNSKNGIEILVGQTVFKL